jgi:hypothetical protein
MIEPNTLTQEVLTRLHNGIISANSAEVGSAIDAPLAHSPELPSI